MKTRLLRAVLSLLLPLMASTVFAQSSPWTWQQRYGEPGNEVCQQVLPLQDGGYLLVGTLGLAEPNTARLYLVRTDAQGQQIWTRTHVIAETTGLNILPACENSAGQVLLSMGTAQGATSAGLLLLLQPDGTIAWQKRTESYPLAPGGIKIDLPYSRAVLDAAGNFLLARNQPGSTVLQRLNAAGDEVERIPFLMPAETLPTGAPAGQALIYDLVPLPTGLFAYVVSAASARLVEVSAQGVQGRITVLPPLISDNDKPNYGVKDFVPLPNDEVLLVSSMQLSRVQLHLGTVRWTFSTTNTSYNLRMNPARAARLPNGRLAVFGYTMPNSHLIQLTMRLFDENGQIVPAPAYPGQVEYSFGTSIYQISAGGLFVNQATGQVVIGGSIQDTPTQQKSFFLWSGPVGALFPGTVTAVSASQLAQPAAWPNPLGTDGQLTVSAAFGQGGPLLLYNTKGQLVRSWPTSATGSGSQQLPMHDLPAGLYLLSGRSAGVAATVRIVKN
ncbi:T9SS type A sorting domain-containing protein [Hymenobacter sp. ISL-91]|uniref:T9SS type A sorting domain-containing protein n=1 Tax=Hymenobacter sp. ISL-91 TaxID=2819151 RepID=UPI001BE6EA10|nr:T9SS type A sorting domain-containing protein [Hymenobacter sp. ISL-91]MBT2557378.1 T9SS type A sorting domain-containing protein [Hymenobacter sp. ISL-91]